MKDLVCYVCSAAIVALRCLLVAALLCSGTITGVILAAAGVVGLASTAAAWSFGRVDRSLTGLLVGVGYLAPLVFDTSGEQSAFWSPVFWALFAAQCWVRYWLGSCCTVTGPVFVRVVDRGPFSVVRHPMTAFEVLLCFAVALEFPSWWNVAALAFALTAKIAICIWEERFLLQQDEYRAYARRVQFRFLPGVW